MPLSSGGASLFRRQRFYKADSAKVDSMESLFPDGPDVSGSSKAIAVQALKNRLEQLELGAWPPSDWERYEMESALLQAEKGNYNFASGLLQMDDNPLRPLVEIGIIKFRRSPATAVEYRQRIEAIILGKWR